LLGLGFVATAKQNNGCWASPTVKILLTLFPFCSMGAAGFVSRQEALIREVDYIELRRWIDQVRSELSRSEAIDVIITRMRTADGEDHQILAGELAGLCLLAGRDDEALQVLGETMARYPDDVRPAISKATTYLYNLKNPEEALRCIDVALQRAYRLVVPKRSTRRQGANTFATWPGRTASDVLEEIMSLQMKKGIPEIGRERDFVDRAPPADSQGCSRSL
jgi:hypothetical protein